MRPRIHDASASNNRVVGERTVGNRAVGNRVVSNRMVGNRSTIGQVGTDPGRESSPQDRAARVEIMIVKIYLRSTIFHLSPRRIP